MIAFNLDTGGSTGKEGHFKGVTHQKMSKKNWKRQLWVFLILAEKPIKIGQLKKNLTGVDQLETAKKGTATLSVAPE